MSQSRTTQLSKFLFLLLMLCASRELSAGIAGNGGPSTTLTNSSTFTEQVNTTNLNQRVDQFSTELKARLQSGPVLLDQIFSASFSDPLVQSALVSAQQLLTVQGAKGFIGPTLLSNNTVLTGSSTTTSAIQTSAPQVTNAITQLIGPASIQVGVLGKCQGIDAAGDPFGCDPNAGLRFAVLAGTVNINVNTNTAYFLDVTNTMTTTFLTSQVYELTGTTAPVGPASVPEPGTLPLAAIAIPGFWLGLRFRRRRREMAGN